MISKWSGMLRQAGSGDTILGRRNAPPIHWRPHTRQRRCFVQASSGVPPTASEPRKLTILHFNDVYNVEERGIEPVGGAPRFAHAVRQFAGEKPLVLFSGDCLNPSLMSAFTRGEQMVPVLNSLGVQAAAVGNHDFDFGIPTLQKHMRSFRFPWLLSNVLDAATGQPLGGALRSHIIDWQGVRVGLMGLVEPEWLLTIPSIEESDIKFLDFCKEGRQLAGELAEQGADLIVALTHMRTPNDLLLAAGVPEIQMVLGGHDHHFEITQTKPHGTHVFKSGTDFREFCVIRLKVPASLQDRPALEWERVEINSSVPEDAEVAAIVKVYQDLIGTKMDEPLGWSHIDLDARFDTVRQAESNLGSLFADVMRISLGADVAFFNGGTIRSDQIHAAGQLLMRDFVSMLPFTDDLVLLELSGADLLKVLETGVGAVPALEGRFLQVSGLRFAFDAAQPAGSRIPLESVEVAGAPLDLDHVYKVATKAYLRGGKDGFDSLKKSTVLVDGETNPRLATLIQYLLMRVEQLNQQLAKELHRMLLSEQQRLIDEAGGLQAEEGSSSSSSSSSSGGNGSGDAASKQPVAVAAGSSSGEAAGLQQETLAGAAVRVGAAVQYSPGSPISGTVTGFPGSIPHDAERHVQEVSSTGAAISLALLLRQRSEQAAGGGDDEDGSQEKWPGLSEEEEAAAHSSAVLSALWFLDPCAHGLDELIVFDAVKRKFGIAPAAEQRIRRLDL
ncbi:hypothetical protein D9Q98_002210 [Chlorella vulgaris]|uniref:5'-nucleotidase n=1 Tax=Chlorella vulgaris TaxID=3077 RepID=A0A9D4Z0P4_CHLVU|nr:hypothetical protein D9Q98_002210 [Chlorella vulgaris]